jgi:hypothetical protein
VEFEEFAIQSRKEAEEFDSLLWKWQQERHGAPMRYMSLPAVWDVCQEDTEGGRLFAAAIDLRINLALLPGDLLVVADVLERDESGGRTPADSILEDPEHFFERMDLLHASLDYVLRLRAVWDKLMGLFVLLIAPAEYQRFTNSQSRKGEFRKIAEASGRIPRDFIDYVDGLVLQFDNSYRTAEAHGSGRMRKFSLVPQLVELNPNELLIWAWNDLNGVLQLLTDFFDKSSSQGVRAELFPPEQEA